MDRRPTSLVEYIGGLHLRYIIRPHRLLYFLSQHFPEQTRTSFGCDTQACLRFWSGLKSSGPGRILFREHGLLRGSTPEQLARTIPLVIHEDAGPFSKSQSVSVLNYSSITGRGAEFDIKFVLGTFIKVSGEGRRPLSDDPGWAAILDSSLCLRTVCSLSDLMHRTLMHIGGQGNQSLSCLVYRGVSCCYSRSAMGNRDKSTGDAQAMAVVLMYVRFALWTGATFLGQLCLSLHWWKSQLLR